MFGPAPRCSHVLLCRSSGHMTGGSLPVSRLFFLRDKTTDFCVSTPQSCDPDRVGRYRRGGGGKKNKPSYQLFRLNLRGDDHRRGGLAERTHRLQTQPFDLQEDLQLLLCFLYFPLCLSSICQNTRASPSQWTTTTPSRWVQHAANVIIIDMIVDIIAAVTVCLVDHTLSWWLCVISGVLLLM